MGNVFVISKPRKLKLYKYWFFTFFWQLDQSENILTIRPHLLDYLSATSTYMKFVWQTGGLEDGFIYFIRKCACFFNLNSSHIHSAKKIGCQRQPYSKLWPILINATSVWTLCDRQEGLKIDAFTSSENARVTDGH